MQNSLPLPYITSDLDRAAEIRKDSELLFTHLKQANTRITPAWQSRHWFNGSGPAKPGFLAYSDLQQTMPDVHDYIFLGMQNQVPYFTLDLSDFSEQEALQITGGGEFAQLRKQFADMHPKQASLLLYARGILHWNRQHRYCFRCGSGLENTHGGHVKRCQNPECGNETYPRSDPAIIVLVEDLPANGEARCLLGRTPKYPKHKYSTLAGFAEPGESLEATVIREVYEESGVRVENPVYKGSQPWPFPASLMVGFRARAVTTEITIDPEELESARWWTVSEIATACAKGELSLSSQDSIARFLILDWLRDQGADMDLLQKAHSSS